LTNSSTEFVSKLDLLKWCSVPAEDLPKHADLRVRYRQVPDSEALGELMAEELAGLIRANNFRGTATRAIIPCGPKCWYQPFSEKVNSQEISLKNLHVFHMDECLDWQGRLLPRNHPYNFRTFMEQFFYGPIKNELTVPDAQRHWLSPTTMDEVRDSICLGPIDITLGGWGQDGHVAYNQARRAIFQHVGLEEIRDSSIRLQENSPDTIIALAHRTFGAAYQFVPPMSITLGMRECLSARMVRVFSDTGVWKQTALRVALFSQPVAEYPMTLLQTHPDAIITATLETARHPISENPDWELQ
jgi:glucosamine-6-phosphate deaminase